jgi:hypothetical protein
LNQFRCGPAGYPSAPIQTIVAMVQVTHAQNSVDLARR